LFPQCCEKLVAAHKWFIHTCSLEKTGIIPRAAKNEWMVNLAVKNWRHVKQHVWKKNFVVISHFKNSYRLYINGKKRWKKEPRPEKWGSNLAKIVQLLNSLGHMEKIVQLINILGYNWAIVTWKMYKIIYFLCICPNSFNNCEMSLFGNKTGTKYGHFSGRETYRKWAKEIIEVGISWKSP